MIFCNNLQFLLIINKINIDIIKNFFFNLLRNFYKIDL